MFFTRDYFRSRDKNRLKVTRWEKIFHGNSKQKSWTDLATKPITPCAVSWLQSWNKVCSDPLPPKFWGCTHCSYHYIDYFLHASIPLRFSFFLNFCPGPAACGILVPQARIEPKPLTLKVWSLNHWIPRGSPCGIFNFQRIEYILVRLDAFIFFPFPRFPTIILGTEFLSSCQGD